MRLMERENMFCIHGPPGCGKTYSISQSVQKNVASYGPTKVIVCSLTKTAAAEAAGRVGLPKGQVGTLHSFAFRALGNPEVAESHIQDWNNSYPAFALASGDTGTDTNATYDVKVPAGKNDEVFAEYTLNRSRMLRRELWNNSVKVFASKWEEWKRAEGLVDFTDMIEFAARDIPVAPGMPDVVYMDEAQDSSTLEGSLLKSWATSTQKTVIVGDPNQSLYTWRGADPEGFFPQDMDKARKFVLSQSYRVPKAVLEASVRWISKMKGYAHEVYKPKKDCEGIVKRLPVSMRSPSKLLERVVQKTEEGKTVMVLASCGFILNPILKLLRDEGVPFHNPYRRRAGNWNPLHASRGVPSKDRVLSWLAPREDLLGEEARVWTPDDLKNWASVLAAKGVFRPNGKKAVASVDEGTDVGLFIRTWFTPESLQRIAEQDFAWWKEHISSSKKQGLIYPLHVFSRRGAKALSAEPKIIVGTVHSVKGGEADVVFVSPELSMKGHQEWLSSDNSSVFRLFYVAMTRAKEELYLLSSGGGRFHVNWD